VGGAGVRRRRLREVKWWEMAYGGGDDSLLEGHERGTRNLKIEENVQVICHFKWKA
jgi:hypothetical protein